MENNMNSCMRLVVLLAMLPLCSCSSQEEQALHKPSEISSRITDSIVVYVHRGEISSQEDFNAARDRFARMLADSMLADGLDREEKYTRAKILFWCGERERANELFRELGQAEDDLSQRVRVQLITMEIEDGEWTSAENMMRDYRTSYPPDPDAPVSLRMCVDDLAGRYNNDDRPEDAVRVIMDEINYLTFDYPYSSFSLFEEVAPLMIETGRIPELKKKIVKVRDGLSEALRFHLVLPAPQDSTYDDYQKLMDSYKSEIGFMDLLLARLDLIGQKAPTINADCVLNADSTFSLDKCEGKITIMDFWTTWCIACVIGYAELDELYSHYSDSDIEIVGITSLQGFIYDLDSGEREGSRDEPISREKELEYIDGYIRKHPISWPCIVSDKTAADPRYFIKGFPTYFILDREGLIRYMHFGVGKQKQIERVIDQLLAES